MEMLDCFAYDTEWKGTCKALDVKACQGETCPFYKSNQEYAQELLKLNNRRINNVKSVDGITS